MRETREKRLPVATTVKIYINCINITIKFQF
jgi:hypothetical protein